MKLPFDSEKSKTGYGISWRVMKWYYIASLIFVGIILLTGLAFWFSQK
jgi:hypothetical protein